MDFADLDAILAPFLTGFSSFLLCFASNSDVLPPNLASFLITLSTYFDLLTFLLSSGVHLLHRNSINFMVLFGGKPPGPLSYRFSAILASGTSKFAK